MSEGEQLRNLQGEQHLIIIVGANIFLKSALQPVSMVSFTSTPCYLACIIRKVEMLELL